MARTRVTSRGPHHQVVHDVAAVRFGALDPPASTESATTRGKAPGEAESSGRESVPRQER